MFKVKVALEAAKGEGAEWAATRAGYQFDLQWPLRFA